MICDYGSFKVIALAKDEIVAVTFTFDDLRLYNGYCRSAVNGLENRRKYPEVVGVKRQESGLPIQITIRIRSDHFSRDLIDRIVTLFVGQSIKYELMKAFAA